ncbi:MAG: hypothetical protein WC551_10045 [Patescibacteria group bacterium]
MPGTASFIFPNDGDVGIGWTPLMVTRTDAVTVANTTILAGPVLPYTVVVSGGSAASHLVGQAATGGGADFIDKAAAGWIINHFQGALIRITAGMGAGQYRVCGNQVPAANANTATRIYVTTNWTTAPDGTSIFEVIPQWEVATLPLDGGRREWYVRKLVPLSAGPALGVLHHFQVYDGAALIGDWTFTTAPTSSVPTLSAQTPSPGAVRIHPRATVTATVNPPSGAELDSTTIEVQLDGKTYIARGVSRHPDATIVRNDDGTWTFTITPRIDYAIRSGRSCKVVAETFGGVPCSEEWAWETDIAGEWPVYAYRAVNSLPDGFDRSLNANVVTFSGGFTAGSLTVTIAETDRWEAVEIGMRVKITGETTTYDVASKTAIGPGGTLTLNQNYAGTTGAKDCLASFDLRAHLAMFTAMGEELALVEQGLCAVAETNSVLDCDPTDLDLAANHHGVKASLNLGIQQELVRYAAWSRLRFPDGAWGSSIPTLHGLAERPTYLRNFVPERDCAMYGPSVRVVAETDQARIILPGATRYIRRLTAGIGVWVSLYPSVYRGVNPGDWIRIYATATIIERQIKRVYSSSGFEWLELSDAIPVATSAGNYYYQITDRPWPSQATGANATFTNGSKWVTGAGFDSLEADWRICPVNLTNTGHWHRVLRVVDANLLELEDLFEESTVGPVNWQAESDERAGAAERHRIVSGVGATANFTAGSTTVTGVGTTWNQVDAQDRLQAGMRIGPNFTVRNDTYGFWGIISSVDSDTQLTLTLPAPHTTGAIAYRAEWGDPVSPSVAIEVPRGAQFLSLAGGGLVLAPTVGPLADGTATFTNGSSTVTGIGTSWTSTVVPGDLIAPSGATAPDGTQIWMIVDAVNSDTEIVMSANWGLDTSVGVSYNLARPLYESGVGYAGLSTLLFSTTSAQALQKTLAAGVDVVTRIIPDP